VLALHTRGTLVKSQSPDKLIAVSGLKDMVVVDSEEALLIMPREDIDKIKDIQKALEERGDTKYL
jgi:hypothetical protein